MITVSSLQQSVPAENSEACAPQRSSASIRLCSLMCASPPEQHLSGNTTVMLIAAGKLWELGVYSAGITNSLKCFPLQGANECYFGKKTLQTFQEESIFCSWEKLVSAKERCCKEHNYTWPVNRKGWNRRVSVCRVALLILGAVMRTSLCMRSYLHCSELPKCHLLSHERM